MNDPTTRTVTAVLAKKIIQAGKLCKPGDVVTISQQQFERFRPFGYFQTDAATAPSTPPTAAPKPTAPRGRKAKRK